MARRRGTVPPRNRNRRQVRTQLRQIHRAISLEPRRVNTPADPPPVPHSFVHATKLPILLLYNKTASTSTFTPGTNDSDPTITFGLTSNGQFVPADLTYNALYLAWAHWTGHIATAWFHGDVCVQKVNYWGPSTQGLTTVAIGLTVDVPAPGSSASVTDVGTPTTRAKCGLTLPCSWQTAPATHVVIRVDCDNEGTLCNSPELMKIVEKQNMLGFLYVTLNVRLTKAT